jgi:hypothetical protein
MARKVRAAFDLKAFLSTVNHGRTLSSVARNAVIFRQSGLADAVFYIQKGRIKIVVTSKQGKEAVVGVLGAGEFFGEGCLIGQPRRLATAKAMTESEIVRVARTEMVRLLHDENPPAAGEFRQGWRAPADHDVDQPGDAGRDHRHDPAPGQPLHEQVQETGLHRVQRPSADPQFPAERVAARVNS